MTGCWKTPGCAKDAGHKGRCSLAISSPYEPNMRGKSYTDQFDGSKTTSPQRRSRKKKKHRSKTPTRRTKTPQVKSSVSARYKERYRYNAVAVTGGSGFLGRRLIEFLVNEDYATRIVILDTNIAEHDEMSQSEKLQQLECDITDLNQVIQCTKGVSAIFHTCSYIDLNPNYSEKIQQINVIGTRNIIDACKTNKIRHLIYTSTTDVVFDGKAKSNASEDETDYPTQYMNQYIRTKCEAEQLVLSANDQDGLKTCSLRPGHIYGPRDYMITILLNKLKHNRLPFEIGDSAAAHDYIYIDNCAEAHLQCWRALAQPNSPVAGEAFFINDFKASLYDYLQPFMDVEGLSRPMIRIPLPVAYFIASIAEAFFALAELFGVHMNVIFTRYVVLAMGQEFNFSCRKAEELFGFKSLYSREEAMKTTANWVAETRGADSLRNNNWVAYLKVTGVMLLPAVLISENIDKLASVLSMNNAFVVNLVLAIAFACISYVFILLADFMAGNA